MYWYQFRPAVIRAAQVWAAAVLACSIADYALAQTATTEERRPAQETEAATAAAAAAEAARRREAAEAPPVTYEQVLAEPDNIDLNYRYAQTQVRQGNLRAAAATLERLLLINPDLAQVRLLYAIVLFRLDNLDEAERELLRVRSLPMPESLQAEIDAYLEQIELRRQRTRWLATVSFGAQYDSNRDAGPERLRAFDTVQDVSGGEDDIAALLIGTLRMRHDLGYQAQHELFGSLTYYQAEQNEVQAQDLHAVSAEAGGTYRGDFGNLSPSVTYSYLRLNREGFLRSPGVRLRFDRRISDLIDLFADNHLQYQDFEAVRALDQDGRATAPTAPDRNGIRNDTEIGLAFTLTPVQQLAVSYIHTYKEAKQDFYAFDGDELQVNHTWLLGKGQFLLTTLAAGVQRYDDPDPLISARTRRDEVYRARITYGVPLGNLLPLPPTPLLDDLTLTVTAEVLRSDSNLENYTYDNVRAQALLTKRWEF